MVPSTSTAHTDRIGDEPVGAGRQIQDAPHRRAVDRCGIEDRDVRGEADGQSPAILDAEHVGGFAGEPSHRFFEREHVLLAHPLAEQRRGRAGVGEPEHARRVREQLRDDLAVGVEDADSEARAERGDAAVADAEFAGPGGGAGAVDEIESRHQGACWRRPLYASVDTPPSLRLPTARWPRPTLRAS